MDSENRFQQLKKRYFDNHTAEWSVLVFDSAKDFPEHAGIQAIFADHLVWKGELDQAIEVLNQAVKLDASDSFVLSTQGTIAAYTGDEVAAMEFYRKSLEIDENNVYALSNHPFILQKAGQSDLADRYLAHLKKAYPNQAKVIVLLSYVPLMKGDLDEVERLLSSYDGSESDRIYVAWSRYYTRKNDWTKSEEMARRAVQVNPECSAGWEHLCMIYRHQGRIAEAKQAGEYALSSNSRAVPALKELAKIAEMEGDKDLADEYKNRAENATPIANEINRIGTDTIKLMQSRNPKLLDSMMREMDSLAGMQQSTRISGLIQFFEGDPGNARCAEFIEKAKMLSAEKLDLTVLESMHLRTLGKFDAAKSVLQHPMQLHPKEPVLLCENLALLCQLKNFDEAKLAADELLEIGIKSPFLYHKVLIPLVDAELLEQAKGFYEQLQHEYPNSDVAKQMQMVMALAQGDISQGLQMFARQGGRQAQITIWTAVFRMLLKLPVLMVKVLLIKLGLIKRKPRP